MGSYKYNINIIYFNLWGRDFMFNKQSKKSRIHKYLETRFIVDKTVSTDLEYDIKDFIVLFSALTPTGTTVYFEYANEKQINKRIAHFDKNAWEQIYISTYKSKLAEHTYTVIVSEGKLTTNLNFISKALASILADKKDSVIKTKDDTFKEKLKRLYVSAISIMLIYDTKKTVMDNQYEQYDQVITQISCGFNDIPVGRAVDDVEKYIAYLIGIGKDTTSIILVGADRNILTAMEKQLRELLNNMTGEREVTNCAINSYKLTRKLLEKAWAFETVDPVATLDEIDIPDIFFGGDDI